MQAATKFESIKIALPKYCKSIEKFIIRLYLFFSSWRQVEEDDNSEFHYLEQEIHTNGTTEKEGTAVCFPNIEIRNCHLLQLGANWKKINTILL